LSGGASSLHILPSPAAGLLAAPPSR